jgi:hypothetical protein
MTDQAPGQPLSDLVLGRQKHIKNTDAVMSWRNERHLPRASVC